MKFRSAGYAAALLAACSPFAVTRANAQSMTGGKVVAGAAQIATGQQGQTSVTQSTTKAVIEWQDFSVAQGDLLRFVQPDSKSITLNRVTGDRPSRIDGTIEANGQVWLLNANGVMIGNQGRVSAAGFLTSSRSLSDEAFLAGRYDFIQTGAADGAIVNNGTIITSGGYAVLAGGQVANSGLIEASLGQIAMGAGRNFTLDLVGDKLLSFAVTTPLDVMPAHGAALDNSGTLRANGGRVLLTARAAADVVDNVINTAGLVQAQSARFVHGEIVLDGGPAGTVRVDGMLDVSGTQAGQTGGTAAVLGDTIILGDTARIHAQGTSGGGHIFVGGGWQGETLYGRPSAVRVAAAAGAVLDASALDSGHGGTVVLWSDVNDAASRTFALGSFYARGGANGGDGGRIETSGHYLSTDGARGSAAAARGKSGLWLFDPVTIEITTMDYAPGGGFVDGDNGQIWEPNGSASYIRPDAIEELLNAGTNVTITTAGGSDTSQGDIYVGAAITKSSGGDATLSMIADGSLYLSNPITSTSGLNLILETRANGMFIMSDIAVDGDVTMRARSGYEWIAGQPFETAFMMEAGSISARNISITSPGVDIYAPLMASQSITIQPFSSAQPIYVGRPSDMPGNFTIDTDAFTRLHAPTVTIGRADGANPLWLNLDLDDPYLPDAYPGDQTVIMRAGGQGGAVHFGGRYDLDGGDILRLIAGSDIFLEEDLAINLAGRLDLLSGERVTNLAGSSALPTVGNGRWFISAASPDDVSFGGLVSGQRALWGTGFADSAATADSASGNRYAFAYAPTIVITAADREKVAGESLSFSPADYTLEGLVDAAGYGHVFEQDAPGAGPLLVSAGAVPSAVAGTYMITVDSSQLPAGYAVEFGGASLVVTPAGVPPVDPPDPPAAMPVPRPGAIIAGVTSGLPAIPAIPPLPAPVSPPIATAPAAAPPPATAGAAASPTQEREQLSFLISPQDPLNPIPSSPVSGQQPPTPRDYADGDDPFLLAADNHDGDAPAQNAERQNGSMAPVAPGVAVDISGMPLSPEIPGIEGRFSGTGDSSKW
ncbi:MAG TPA: filamentous hemagglutinin N-terminal domain-containing protein [Sphingobium sp.]|nr:filamentous hemagglutinin N-terminal domain-containing protein [Sphingobium sp.]